jgi:hypothetical protein
MNYRLSFVFTAGQQGWSEVWYYISSSSPSDVIGEILTPDTRQFYLGCRGKGVIFNGLRVNNIDVPRQGFFEGEHTECSQYSKFPSGLGEQPQVAALGTVVTAGGHKRSFMVRGLCDDDVSRDAGDMPIIGGNLLAKLNALSEHITVSMGLCARILQPPSGNNPDRICTAMGPKLNDMNSTTFTYSDPNPVTKGTAVPILVHGLSRKKWPGYAGVLPSFNQTLTTFDVPVIWRSSSPTEPLRNVTARNALYALEAVSLISWEDMRVKKTGRPISLSRGRRSAVQYRAR